VSDIERDTKSFSAMSRAIEVATERLQKQLIDHTGSARPDFESFDFLGKNYHRWRRTRNGGFIAQQQVGSWRFQFRLWKGLGCE
jgi:hypothetical protein